MRKNSLSEFFFETALDGSTVIHHEATRLTTIPVETRKQ